VEKLNRPKPPLGQGEVGIGLGKHGNKHLVDRLDDAHSSRGICGRNENALTGLALDHDSSRSLNHDHKALAQQSWEDLVLREAGDLKRRRHDVIFQDGGQEVGLRQDCRCGCVQLFK